ncbi:J domain-containing protein [Sphingomonas sp. BK580]|uniref:J domain-containing protein n=1 Tax=Sphingomonas sp. BK580 TaxID=2586972 RepID=UPI0017A6B9CE|nr:hypothetical protein [Sphingomonas sp. BK580]
MVRMETIAADGRRLEPPSGPARTDRARSRCERTSLSRVFTVDKGWMAHSPDYYSVLGVPTTASRDVIHAAWKALLRQYHPDANHGVDVSARAKEINEAYAVLGKREARAAYDRSQIRPSLHRATADRSFHHRKAGRRSTRPYPSMQPNGSFSQPLETNEWLMGLFLLILTAAPIATILVLYYEDPGVASTVRRDVAAHPVPEAPPKAVPSSSRTKLGPGQPAP